ncbi:MAG TPA: GH116 family glycosyl hydrolase [Candidatus Hydrogenedentes bacterium]|nr:GH116 family glycosyl hydrolase [Candidatus Hydrogenedentota bacterium]HPG69590.1 GH116 family glycosyl hydrolase [Candidatus Hydrogenedentota bacterium]
MSSDKKCCKGQCALPTGPTGYGPHARGVGRRDFLKVAGAGLVATSFGMPAAVMAGPFEASDRVEHFVPADKKLARGWVQSLYDRGTPEVHSGEALKTIGMPIGGIACGQLYLCGDGTLANWEIFNRYYFGGTGATSYTMRHPKKPVKQGFAVVLDVAGQRTLKTLDVEGFSDVCFRGEYPIGTVRYAEEDCPVRVEMEAFSPFIPLNAKDSALPATLFHITAENVGSAPVSVSVAGWLENAVCMGSAPEIRGQRASALVLEKGRTLVVHTAEEAPKPPKEESPRPPMLIEGFEGENYGQWEATGVAFGSRPARGTLLGQQKVSGYEGEGLVNTFLGGDEPHGMLTSPPFTIERKQINFLMGGGNHPGRTCMNLVVDGHVVCSAAGINSEELTWHTWRVDAWEGKQARLQIVDEESGGWGHISVDHIEMADVSRQGPTGPINALDDWGTLVLAFDGDGGHGAIAENLDVSSPDAFHGAAEARCIFPASLLGAAVTPTRDLAPGAKHTFVFALAWHMPNFPNGHEYVNRFASASEVAHYIFDNRARLAADTRAWRDVYYDSSLPYWLLDRLHSTVANLATGTCEWWENGRFWAYEGVVCCGGTCTHVWNYAHAHARLFPELARSVREMQDFNPDGGGFHPDTGLVGFRSNDAYAADGQCGTILKAYREHQMSADDTFLRRNWERIKMALDFSIRQDGNDDGLIENSQHNTYDINFEGPNTMVGSLYLAALRAGEEMAMDVGDHRFAKRVRRIYERGRQLTMDRLWNGEYFVQDVDLEKHPKHQYGQGCLSDQLFGQGWARQLHLGEIYPEDAVEKTYQSIWKYNWAPDVTPQNDAHTPLRWFVSPGEAGLFTCTWPKSEHLSEGVMYKNEVWTGIEYQVAGGMIWEGMVEQALAMCRAVHDRYHPLKHNPYNEVECGDHYARAMASWGVYLALCGYEYHGPRGYLAFSPRMVPEAFKAAFTTAEGWGSFEQQRRDAAQHDRIIVTRGNLFLRTLAFDLAEGAAAKQVVVAVGGKTVRVQHEQEGCRVTIRLADGLTLASGQSLDVSFA